MSQKIHPSVIDQLKIVAKILKGLELYSNDVDGKDMTDVLFYSQLLDKINGKIKEMEDSK